MSLDGCRLLYFPSVADARGNLTFVEADRHVPFPIRRVYYLYDIPSGATRGGHAHKGLQQVLVAASGRTDIVLDDGIARRRVTLDRPDVGLYLPRMIWREMENFSAQSVLLVFASEYYDEDDYYRDYDAFARAVETSSA